MSLVKECPSCHFENPAEEVLCQQCGIFIASEIPKESTQPSANAKPLQESEALATQIVAPDAQKDEQTADASATVLITSSVSFSDTSGKHQFEARDGDVLGRQGVGSAYFQNFNTVSRKHAIIHQTADGWAIEDRSANGTYVNGQRIHSITAIANGDTLQFSTLCTLNLTF